MDLAHVDLRALMIFLLHNYEDLGSGDYDPQEIRQFL